MNKAIEPTPWVCTPNHFNARITNTTPQHTGKVQEPSGFLDVQHEPGQMEPGHTDALTLSLVLCGRSVGVVHCPTDACSS